MAVLRWDPWGDVAALQRDMNTLLGRAFSAGEQQTRPLVPAIDAFRSDEGLTVRLEVPGVDPADIEIDVAEGLLTIAGERKSDETVEDDRWVRRERVHGRFERSFSLPEGTNPDSISARYEHGVLELSIPSPEQRRPRRIQIAGADPTPQDIEVESTVDAEQPVGASA